MFLPNIINFLPKEKTQQQQHKMQRESKMMNN